MTAVSFSCADCLPHSHTKEFYPCSCEDYADQQPPVFDVEGTSRSRGDHAGALPEGQTGHQVSGVKLTAEAIEFLVNGRGPIRYDAHGWHWK